MTNSEAGSADEIGVGNGFDNVITGNAGNNSLLGGAGNDMLVGGADDDALSGGAGNHSDYLDAAGETVIEIRASGTDAVHALVDFTLSADVEILVLEKSPGALAGGSDKPDDLTGDSPADVLSGDDYLPGGDGDDTLDGGAGSDTMFGGEGNDTFVYDAADIATGAVNGGAGTNDTVLIAGSVPFIDFGMGDDFSHFASIERWDISGTGDNMIRLSLSGILTMLGTLTGTFTVDGDAFDVVDAEGQGWLYIGTVAPPDPEVPGATYYEAYSYVIPVGGIDITLYVDQEITQLIS